MNPMVLTDPTKTHNDTAIPIFYTKAVKDEAKYRETGVIAYIDTPYVEILVPGSKDTNHFPVEDEHRRRWPAQWAAYLAKKEAPLDGMPLAQWPGIGPADKATLEANNIKTVEALANLPESNLLAFGPNVLVLKQNAVKFLSARESWEGKSKDYEALIAKKDEEIAALKARVAELESAPKVERKKRTTKVAA